ncbi:MAG: GIY-YIG nuclease family protein [Ignavibacteriaceae bacterium]|nr:GIY-YIG nuclease family protein [Ignavibacteriaceae bacterium]
MSYFVYILKSQSAEKYYTGISANPELRLSYHNTTEKGFTSRYRPWEIVFTKEYPSKEIAHQAELKIKNWKNRSMIERVISGEIQV